MGIPFLGLGHRGIRWVIPSQVGIKSPSNDFCHRQTLLLASFLQLFFLSFGDIDVNSFLGHLSHLLLTCTNILMYDTSISERRKQTACWSTSTNLMEARNKRHALKRLFVLSSSSATNACVCGWMARISPTTTCRPIALCLPKNIPSPLALTPKPVKH